MKQKNDNLKDKLDYINDVAKELDDRADSIQSKTHGISNNIKKANNEMQNLNDTLKVTDENFLKKLQESQEVLSRAKEIADEQTYSNFKRLFSGLSSIVSIVTGNLTAIKDYFSSFWTLQDDSKPYYIMKREATVDILQEEIDALKQKRELGKELLAQREQELAQLQAGKLRIETDAKWTNPDLLRQEINQKYAIEYSKLFEKEMKIVSEISEEELDAQIQKFEKGAEKIQKGLKMPQHRDTYGVDEYEGRYHTNTHKDQLKSLEPMFSKQVELLSLTKEIGNEAIATGTKLFQEQNQINDINTENVQKSAAEIKEIHFDANAAILENEETFQQGLSELKATEEDKRKKSLQESSNDSLEVHKDYNREVKELQEDQVEGIQAAAVQADTSIIQKGLAEQSAALTQTTTATEGKSLKTRIQQWKEYGEKVSAISNKVSEVTGIVTNSLGSMFSQLSASYTQELEEINEKIAALDEEKEVALESVALTEDERAVREEELQEQRMNSLYAITYEEKAKADERIAILQGELNAEDTVNREFESKKAELEKEKEEKEKAQKQAEKQQKRLEMGQSIVEATGNIALGVTNALKYGPILGPILAAVVGAAGAIQVGIMTKQLSKMEDGGLLRGKRHAQGGMRIEGSNIEVEGGEYVVNRQSTARNMSLLSYINGHRRQLNADDVHAFFASDEPRFQVPQYPRVLESTGQVPMLPMPVDPNAQILEAIQNINFQPHVSVTDINHVQKQMALVDEWVGMT